MYGIQDPARKRRFGAGLDLTKDPEREGPA